MNKKMNNRSSRKRENRLPVAHPAAHRTNKKIKSQRQNRKNRLLIKLMKKRPRKIKKRIINLKQILLLKNPNKKKQRKLAIKKISKINKITKTKKRLPQQYLIALFMREKTI